MSGFIKFALGVVGLTYMIEYLGADVPAGAQLIAYAMLMAAYIARKDD